MHAEVRQWHFMPGKRRCYVLTMAGCWKIVAGSWRALAGLLLAACCGAAIAQATVPAVIGSEASCVEAKAGEQAMARDVICVATVALARGKVILFYAYANRLGQQDVAWAREVSRLWIAEFLKINPA
jgi:hypothetical protein